MTDNIYALVADIGGTNTRVALADSAVVRADTIKRYPNAEYPGLAEVLRQYLSDLGGATPAAACIAVAGPVRDGKGTLTNLDWTMDLQTLRDATQAGTVDILNDLQAQGHAIGHIADENLQSVLPGQPTAMDAARLVIGVGTGFNAAPVFDVAGGRFVPASESGHVSFPARSEKQRALRDYITERHGFAAVEDVLSGRGLERVHNFCGIARGNTETRSAQQIMDACKENDPQSREAVALSVAILGGTCGNLALTLLPFGGINLVGGVARAFAPYLEEFDFASGFRDKGRFAGFMDQFPVAVVHDDYAALTGCAAHLSRIVET